MAYRITYEWQKEQELTGNSKQRKWFVAGMMAVTAALAVRLLMPQPEGMIRELLHPFTDGHTVTVFGEMVNRIGEGTPLPEAVTAFCREILEHGN